MSRGLLWTCVVIGSVLSLAAAGRIVDRQLIIGSPDGGWFYGYFDRFETRTVESFLISCVLTAAVVAATWPWLIRLTDDKPALGTGRELTLILAWCLLALGLQGLLRWLTPFSFEALFASDNSNSFYSVARKFEVNSILSDFERLRPSWALHAKSNLPGKLLLVRGLLHISRSPEVLAWLIVLISNLGGVLVYLFVRDLFGDRQLAAIATILYLFTPAKLYFFPLLNTVTPVAVFASACLLLLWLNTGRILYAALLGVAVYGLILFEPTALVSGVLFAMVLVRGISTGRMSPRSALFHVGVGVLTFAATHAAMLFWFRFDLISAFRHVAADAVAFNVEARRPYEIWVRQNIFDFAFGVGLCQMVLFVGALADGVVRLKNHDGSRGPASIVLTCAAIIAMVGLADGIGVNRGEVIRLWIFLACLAQIPSAYMCRRLSHPMVFTLVLATTLLQDALGTAMLAFIVP